MIIQVTPILAILFATLHPGQHEIADVSGPALLRSSHGSREAERRVDAIAADLVLRGGKVFTGSGLPDVEAIAVKGGRIFATGVDALMTRHVGSTTRVIELGGRRVVPGFVDAHVHLLMGGDGLLGRDLRYEPTMEGFARGLAELAASRKVGAWITAATWDHERWPGTPLPHRRIVDPLVPDHPVFVSRTDGHMALANSLALRIAGITKDTPDPPGGTIVRDQDGEPTGVLKDAAMDLVAMKIPSWSMEERRERILAAMEHARERGVTWMHDMGMEAATWRTLRVMREAGELTSRVTGYVPRSSFESARSSKPEDDPFLNRRGFKAFVDGSLGSTTALFFDPYVDAPETRGLSLIDTAAGGILERTVAAAVSTGWQPAVHAIGDRANHELLDLFERAETQGARCRIEHAQHLVPADIERFSELGVIASMQPYHAVDDGRWAEERIGAERCRTTYAFRSLLDAGAMLAFGSDWPVAPLSPLLGVHAAVTRATLDGAHPQGWIPEQRITVQQAITAYTTGGAYAARMEDRLGKLVPGYLADLVVLDSDPFSIEPSKIIDVRVDVTIVEGRVVYERP
ncbi:MAG: amidohydrolase [Planctomycetes bacterium]|nr:amidohydrolase [Planctomycetota bacterium]